MKSSRLTQLLVAASLALSSFSHASSANESTEEGIKAYQAGEYKTAFKKLTDLSNSGNPKAAYYVGLMHRDGVGGLKKSPAKAIRHLTTAAKAGVPGAADALAQLNGEQSSAPAPAPAMTAEVRPIEASAVASNDLPPAAESPSSPQPAKVDPAATSEGAKEEGTKAKPSDNPSAPDAEQPLKNDKSAASKDVEEAKAPTIVGKPSAVGEKFIADARKQSTTTEKKGRAKGAKDNDPTAPNVPTVIPTAVEVHGTNLDPGKQGDNVCAGMSADAAYRQGQRFLDAKDMRNTFACFEISAGLGHAQTLITIAQVFAAGTAVKQDHLEAMNWYEMAANRGIGDAAYQIGRMHEKGLGVPKDYKEAARWYAQAIDKGSILAAVPLGAMYATGVGVERDYAKAFELLQGAANAGDPVALFNIGVLYSKGHGVPQNYKLAETNYRKAADKRHAGAMNNLGFAFEFGQAQKANLVEAHKWYNLAATLGEPTAADNRTRVEQRLPPELVAKAQQEATDWLAKHPSTSRPM